MLDERTLKALLIETHYWIDDVASKSADQIGSGELDHGDIVYPPEYPVLTDEELEALRSLRLTDVQRSAIQKLIADAAANAFFCVYSLMDAVGDPVLAPWDGLWLGVDLTSGIPKVPYFPFMHDELLDSYWDFKRLRENQPRTTG